MIPLHHLEHGCCKGFCLARTRSDLRGPRCQRSVQPSTGGDVLLLAPPRTRRGGSGRAPLHSLARPANENLALWPTPLLKRRQPSQQRPPRDPSRQESPRIQEQPGPWFWLWPSRLGRLLESLPPRSGSFSPSEPAGRLAGAKGEVLLGGGHQDKRQGRHSGAQLPESNHILRRLVRHLNG